MILYQKKRYPNEKAAFFQGSAKFELMAQVIWLKIQMITYWATKMSERVFVDTGFVFALINPNDQFHQKATALSVQFEVRPLLTTDAVLLEIGNAFSRRFRTESAKIIQYFLDSSDTEIARLTPALFKKGFDLYKTYQDKEWGLVDCVSFVAMRDKDVTEALTFDRHFIQAGFHVLT